MSYSFTKQRRKKRTRTKCGGRSRTKRRRRTRTKGAKRVTTSQGGTNKDKVAPRGKPDPGRGPGDPLQARDGALPFSVSHREESPGPIPPLVESTKGRTSLPKNRSGTRWVPQFRSSKVHP